MASDTNRELSRIRTERPHCGQAGFGTQLRRFFLIPPEVISRVLVILGALAMVKLGLLITLRKHLQETHWRFGGESESALGVFAFYAIALVLAGCLFQFGQKCKPQGVRAVRVANALILLLGALLIFLTFHEGDHNYIYPVMMGFLKWTDLWSYLSLNLFFRPPFLSVWMFAYAAGYYVLARTGREAQVLSLTAVFAALYWLLCWREFMFRKSDLCVILLFGVFALLMLRLPKRPFHAAWLLLPAVWTSLIWCLFTVGKSSVARVQPLFLVLISCLVVLFTGLTLLARRERFLDHWVRVLPFLFVTVLMLANSNYPTAVNYNNLLSFVVKFPHYFLGELLLVLAIGAVATVWKQMRPGGGLGWVDLVGGGFVVLAILDLRLVQIMGVRLGWDVIVFANDPRMAFQMAAPYLPALGVGLVIGVAIYILVVRALTRRLRCPNAEHSESSSQAGWYLAGCFCAFAVTGAAIAKRDNIENQTVFRLVQSTPLWKNALNQAARPADFFKESDDLGMPRWNETGTMTSLKRRDLNVVLIFQESTYNQHLSLFGSSQETQPLLSQYKDRMEIFPNFFSSYASSIHARFAAFAGLYPVNDFNRFTLDRVPVRSIFEVLSQNGYECSLFYSSFFDYTGFGSFLRNRDLREMYDCDTMPGDKQGERVAWGLKEEVTTAAMRQRIRQYAEEKKKFFMTYVPAAPHKPYDKTPPEFCKFSSKNYGDYTADYLNALLYMDWNITSVLDELKATGLLDRTLVIITSDHGEMLGENNGPVGHGWRITPQLANVPLIVMDPDQKGHRINHQIGSQVDLLPTILDSLGLEAPRELYQGQSMYSLPPEGGRSIYLNSYDDFAVITGREMRISSRSGGSPNRVYRIENSGTMTRFTEIDPVVPSFAIKRFDDFQDNFLKEYGIYRKSLTTRPSTRMLQTSR